MGTKKYPLESFQTHYSVQRKHIILKIERFRNVFFQTLTPLLFPAPLFVAYFDCADREDDGNYEEEDSPDETSRHSLPLGVLRNVVLVLLTAKTHSEYRYIH